MSLARRRVPLVMAGVLAAASCDRAGSESWGFVATLGDDTTSVERITRDGDVVTGIAVGRSPLVVLRRWEATLAPDGSIRRWSMDTRIANAPAGETELHHELEPGDGAIRLLRRTGRDTTDATFAPPYDRIVPWNAFLYATFESLVAAARDLPDSARIGVYFFEGWEEGRIGHARVRRLGGDSVAISSTGLSGEGVARIDAQGRLLSYSGAGTTYKQEVRRVTNVPDIEALYERFASEERARGVSRSLSARDTARATVHGVDVAIDYGRPLARGRTLVGGIIPYDRVWRTGANAATHITLSGPLRLGGVPLDAGTYTLWTLPARDGVQLVLNRQTGQWGTGYGASHDIARVPMQVDSSRASVERFTIRVDPTGPRLVMEWGTFRWSVPVDAPR